MEEDKTDNPLPINAIRHCWNKTILARKHLNWKDDTSPICYYCKKDKRVYAVHDNEKCKDINCKEIIKYDIPCMECFKQVFDIVDNGVKNRKKTGVYTYKMAVQIKN